MSTTSVDHTGISVPLGEDYPEIRESVRRICEATGYHGAFEVEFIPSADGDLLMDFNPRYYGQMQLEISRGLPIPELVACDARWQPFPPLAPAGDMDAQLFISSPEGGGESMHLMYLMAIASARESLDVHAAYFVPDALTMRALKMALKRGVRLRVLVPGEHIDSDLVKVSSRAIWGDLLQGGAQIHVYQPTMMHVKSLVVDGYLVSVGSTNFDVRSFQLNDEASLNIYDRDFARHMTETFERDLLRAKPYTLEEWEERPWTERLHETVVLPFKSQL